VRSSGNAGRVLIVGAFVAVVVMCAAHASLPGSALATALADDVVKVTVIGEGATEADAIANAERAAIRKTLEILVDEKRAKEALDALEKAPDSAGLSAFVTVSGPCERLPAPEGRVRLLAEAHVKTTALRRRLVTLGLLGDAERPTASPTSTRVPELKELAPIANVRLRVRDPSANGGDFLHSDVTKMTIGLPPDYVAVEMELVEPLREGMFTVIETWFDCDGNLKTGLDGAEIRTRASIGSRFRANAYIPPRGFPHPLSLLRGSWMQLRDHRTVDGRSTQIWMNIDSLSAEAGAHTLRGYVPRKLLRKAGWRYATAPMHVWAKITTTCAEHPLIFEYDALGDGRAIKVDGRGSDWSGGPHVEDEPDELHHAARRLDILGVWAEHDATSLLVRVDFQIPGFGQAVDGGDVAIRDVVELRVQPLGDAYMEPIVAFVRAGSPRGTARVTGGNRPTVTFATTGSVLEIRVPRTEEQRRFRIAVWSEAVRVDEVGDPYRNVLRLQGAR